MPKVTYSIGARFAGGGIGNVAFHDVKGFYEKELLHRLLCGSARPTDIPSRYIRQFGIISRILRKTAVYDSTQFISFLHNTLYDRWAAANIIDGDAFVGWGGFSLRSITKATSLHMLSFIIRASSHPRYQANILKEEYKKWGLNFRINEHIVVRNEQEIDLADYVIIPSDFVKDSFLEMGFPENRLVKIPFGVDINRFHPLNKKKDHNSFKILFVGQIGIRKGIPYLLEAWKKLGWMDAELWLVGNLSKDIQPIISKYPEMPGLKFLGYSSNLVPIYQSADVFVFPSIEEGSALVNYEALACGVPVITTPNAGSIVRDQQDGFLVPIRDTEALVEKLAYLKANLAIRDRLSKNARERVENFTWAGYEKRISQKVYTLIKR